MDQHAKLPTASKHSSLKSCTDISEDPVDQKLMYQYDDTCIAYSSCTSSVANQKKTSYHSTWDERATFLLTSIGFTTGLQSICLFPVLCATNGGAAFVFCTFILYLVLGIPVFLLESGIGQLSRQSPASLFPRLCPLLSGLGLSMCWSSVIFTVSEGCFLSWTVLYIYKSAGCDLPWASHHNFTGVLSSATYFLEVLEVSPGLAVFGHLNGQLVLSLLFVWLAVASCLAAGIRHTGKLCYITAPASLSLATVLLIRGLLRWNVYTTQVIAPDWSYLLDLSVWLSSGCYVFHSLNLGLGGLTAISSYNKPRTNIPRDGTLACLVHFIWGIMMWLIYSCLTAEFQAMGEMSGIVVGGPTVLFVFLARGLAALPHGILFSIILYVMIFLIGFGTMLGAVLNITSAVIELCPLINNKRGPLTLIICLVLFFLGLPLTSQAGFHLQLMLSHYALKWPLILYSLLLSLAISNCYGQKRFILDLCLAANWKVKDSIVIHLTVLFMTIVPVLLLVVLLIAIYNTTITPGGEIPYPEWAKGTGWFLGILPILLLLFGAIFRMLQFLKSQSISQGLRMLVRADESWTENMQVNTHSPGCEKTTMSTPIVSVESSNGLPINSDDGFAPQNESEDKNNNHDNILNRNIELVSHSEIHL